MMCLYGKVKTFVRDELFDRPVDLESPNTLRNLSELVATKTVIESFQKSYQCAHRAEQRRCRNT